MDGDAERQDGRKKSCGGFKRGGREADASCMKSFFRTVIHTAAVVIDRMVKASQERQKVETRQPAARPKPSTRRRGGQQPRLSPRDRRVLRRAQMILGSIDALREAVVQVMDSVRSGQGLPRDLVAGTIAPQARKIYMKVRALGR